MDERITLRLSEGDRLLVQAVALAAGVTISEWVRARAIDAARDWLRQRGIQPEELEHVQH